MKELLTLVALVFGIAVTPQQPPQFEKEIKTTRLTDSLYLLEGGGGNVAAFVWDEGVLLVDDKIAPASPRLKAAVAAITPKPIRFVVNSHWHPDHRGGNEALAQDGSVIVAHENVRRRRIPTGTRLSTSARQMSSTWGIATSTAVFPWSTIPMAAYSRASSRRPTLRLE